MILKPQLLYLVYLGSALCTFTAVVELEQGRLRGLRSVSGQNRYYGIPYGTAERFQPPGDPPKWGGIFFALDRLGSCAQSVSIIKLGTEDCLHLDVYTPEHAGSKDNLPVLVFIHGGAYYYGSKAHYDPEFLVAKNVVVVIVNYRVGVLGFLCIKDVANLGLKDQVAALKWIKKNISVFGGDPDNVTVSGQSAGASAAAMHMLSRSSKGLFHKAILMSGTSITPWSYNVEPQTPAFEDARKIRQVSDIDDVYNALYNAPVNELLEACRDTSINPKYFKYSPCIDSNLTNPFFQDTPYNIIESGHFNKVPMIIGFASVEGMLFYGLNDEITLKDLNDQFVERLPSVFSWCSEKDKKKIAVQIRSYYFKRMDISKSAIRGVVDFYSDWLAYSSVDAFSRLMTKYSNESVYNYMFSYEGGRNFAKALFGQGTRLKGASHSDDIFYIFKPAGLSILLSNADKLFIDRLTAMITNFMKFGDPTPRRTKLLPVSWPATTSSNSLIMTLDHELSVSPTPSSHKGLFFMNMLCTYGQSGYVPCASAMQCSRQ